MRDVALDVPTAMLLESAPLDVVILTNGPGEVLTWVRPVVLELHRQAIAVQQRQHLRISVILSPCPHASGQEVEILRSWREVDRVQAPAAFSQFLFSGKTAQNWSWHPRGVVVFLGGDRLFPVLIGRRLGYRTVVYAEWETQWSRWIDRFAAMNELARLTLPKRDRYKCEVIGDLMADAAHYGELNSSVFTNNFTENFAEIDWRLNPPNLSYSPNTNLIGLLPGSKPMKLKVLLPFMLAIVDLLQQNIRENPSNLAANLSSNSSPNLKFFLPVSPTLNLTTLSQFAAPEFNPLIQRFQWSSGTLIPGDSQAINPDDQLPYLRTSQGNRVYLWTQTPAYNLLDQCTLCLTTVGANTAELGALAKPMIVLLPLHQLDVMRAWDGLPGLLANLPIVGGWFAALINRSVLWWLNTRAQGSCLAWPNIWANRQGLMPIVPELLGRFSAGEVVQVIEDWLTHPDKLEGVRERLRSVRGEPGAAQRLVGLIWQVIVK